MPSIVLYDFHSESPHELGFLKNKELATQIICPGPQVADGLREKIDDAKIVTIANYIKTNLANVDLKTTKKSDLFRTLALAWKYFYKDKPYNLFNKSFELFTELRSVSLDYDLISEVLKLLDPSFLEPIQKFWLFVESQNIIDEQLSYKSVAEINHEEHDEVKNIIFWGFSFLSGVQIDLIKSLDRYNKVYIPIPKSIFNELKASDWPKWLMTTEDDLIKLKGNESEKSVNEFEYQVFSKGNIGKALQKGNKDIHQKILLFGKGLDFNHFNQFPKEDLFFKSPISLFDLSVKKIFSELTKNINAKKFKTTKEAIDCLKSEAQNTKVPTTLKSYFAVITELVLWEEMASLNEELTLFDLKVLEEITILNLPRNFNLSIKKNQPKYELFDLNDLDAIERDAFTLIAASDFGKVKDTDEAYSEEVLKLLMTIGPVRRKRLENEILKQKLLENLTSKDSHLYIEDNFLEQDDFWISLINQGNGKEIESIELDENRETKISFEKNKKGNLFPLSASKFQSYLDCPQKYYYERIDRKKSDVELEEDIEPREKGEIQHLIIEKYFESFSQWKESEHRELCEKLLEEFKLKKQKRISEIKTKEILIELIYYSKNGILELLKLKEIDPNITYTFEKDFSEERFRGQVDCIVQSPIYGRGLVDFKRSKSSIPTNSEFENFKKIQLFFYVDHLEEKIDWFSGFLCLSDPIDSNFYAFNANTYEDFENIDFCSLKFSKKKREFNLDQALVDYQSFEAENISRMAKDSLFMAEPLSKNVCRFCDLINLCDKGQTC